MIKVIKTDNKNNFFYDKKTEEKLNKYDPDNTDIILRTELEDGSILEVDHSAISINNGSQLYFEYNNDKYIIDDGYQDLLVRAGYIILNDYNTRFIDEKDNGLVIRDKLRSFVTEIIEKMWDDKECLNYEVSKNMQELVITFSRGSYDFTVNIDTVNNIVTKNQIRKENNLPFYPFLKNMDKYGTLYLSIFAKKNDDSDEITEKYESAERFILNLCNLLNTYAEQGDEYKFERIIIKKRLNNWKENWR